MQDDSIKIAVRAGWDAMSASYQDESAISTSDVHYAPFAPGERHYRLLGDVRGKRILELACGGAQNSVALSSWGADVVGLDISSNQLGFARSLRVGTGQSFDLVAGDMAAPVMFRPSSFDVVLSAFGWEFIPDLRGCLAQCGDLIRPGGQLLMSTVHPLTAFDWDMGRSTLLVTDYFNPPVEVWEEPVPEGHSPGLTFFRTIEELVSSVTDAGLVVEKLLEPYPLEPDGEEESPYAGRYWTDHIPRLERVPFAVVISARKPTTIG